jgi:hypothetical protein
MYWDNSKDRAFDEAIDEMIREERALRESYENAQIGNPQKLIGAQ